MAHIILGEHEEIESALRRFRRKVVRADIFRDIKKKRYFETPSEKRKRKELARHKESRKRHNRRR